MDNRTLCNRCFFAKMIDLKFSKIHFIVSAKLIVIDQVVLKPVAWRSPILSKIAGHIAIPNMVELDGQITACYRVLKWDADQRPDLETPRGPLGICGN